MAPEISYFGREAVCKMKRAIPRCLFLKNSKSLLIIRDEDKYKVDLDLPVRNYVRASYLILECLNVKRLGQKCNTLLKRLTVEQLKEFNKIIDQILCDLINDNQIPKVLEFTLKIIENIIKKRSTITEVLNTYHIPNETSKEKFKHAELESKEEKVDLELLQKLVATCNDLILKLIPAPEIETADGICTLGPYCENRSEIKRNVKKELEIEIDKYKDKRKKEEEDLFNNQIRVAEIEIEVKKDETKAYEVEVDKNKDEIDKRNNIDFEVVDKTAKIDYIEETFESSLETGINIVIKILWNHQKCTGIDSKRKLDKLEKVSLEKKFVDDEPPDESDCDTLTLRRMKTAKEINEPTKRELTEETVKVRDCSQGRIEVKIDETKEPSCCYKSVELGNITRAFMSSISVCKSEETAFELDLKPIERGLLDNLKSVIENTFKNNDM
ncbi:hypothetical protein C2G38_2160314 [Gigaspora rosea]|uniref:Uncharacterized protein n=1 Tax=Gigaspora rosea TaxID=44941 RepID=A0A397W0J9_9GLOM|nr:hypothetical protein C2G38_2160314 [Gigaspora rosea]